MKKVINKLVYIVNLISVAITALIYDKIPNQIPHNFDAMGNVNKVGDKSILIFTGLIPLGMLILLELVKRIDPKRESYKVHRKSYNITKNAISLFLVLVHWLLIVNIFYNINVSVVIKVLMALLFIILGNYMNTFKQNFFMGIRTPWTLSSETVWRKTHRVGGYVFVAIGVSFIIDIFTKDMILSTIVMLVGVTFVIAYSYFAYRKENWKK